MASQNNRLTRALGMPTGAPLLPVTKIGAGDKERAYVVRQNALLKFLLLCVCLVSGFSTALVYTRYEVHIQRRQSIEGAKSHREEEHASHMRVMRLSMLLQRHLEDEVHDVAVLTTYRAWLMRAVGDYQMRVVGRASNCSSALKEGLQAEGVQFDQEIEKLLKLLWDDVVKEGKQAQKQLHNITHAIVTELREDASEQGEYEAVMAEAGEDPGFLGYHNHEIDRHGHEYHDHHHHHHHEAHDAADGDHHGGDAAEHHYHEYDDPPYPPGSEHEHPYHHHEGDDDDEHDEHPGGHHAGDEDDEDHLAGALEALMSRLQHNESVVVGLSNATLEEWEELRESSLRSLQDDEQEVDMQRVELKIQRAINASHVHLPPYDENEGGWLDHLTELIRKAKLAPYRTELLALLTSWQAGEVRISEPLNRIEELIDQEVLDPDVLILHGDYEHYRYD